MTLPGEVDGYPGVAFALRALLLGDAMVSSFGSKIDHRYIVSTIEIHFFKRSVARPVPVDSIVDLLTANVGNDDLAYQRIEALAVKLMERAAEARDRARGKR